MAIQFISSFLLWYFWAKISAEDDTDNEQRENITQSLDRVLDTLDGCIYSRIDTRLNTLNTIYTGIAAETRQNSTPPTKTPLKTPKIIGFDSLNTPHPKTPEKTAIKQDSTATVLNLHGTPENGTNGVKTCLFCGVPLSDSQIIRHAKFCSPKCRITHYNNTHPERKPINLNDADLS